MTERKRLALTYNAMKHGKYCKNKTIIKAVTPTPFERAAGVTMEDKIQILKATAPTLASMKVGEALTNYGMTLAEIKNEILALEKMYEKASESDKDRIVAAKSKLWWKMKYAEKEWEFVSNVFGVGKPTFTLESETETAEVQLTLNKIMEKVLGEIP